MAKKQHQLDRDRSSGYLEFALCGREMPRENTWGFESCERCANVARSREDKKTKTRAASVSSHAPRNGSKTAQLNAEIAAVLARKAHR